MNRNSVVMDDAAAQPASLRFAAGSKESEALVELFLRGEREPSTKRTGAVATAAHANGRAPAAPPLVRPACAPVKFVASPMTGSDALDMLIDGLDDQRALSGDSSDQGEPREAEDVSLQIDGPVDRPAVLAECLTGLRSIDARCPYAPGVELATDEGGALHLIAWRGAGEAGGSAIAELQIASKWAWEHIRLLTKIAPLDARVRPAVQHIVTADRAGLRNLLTTSLRVHLAIAVDGDNGKARTWMCAALNEA